MRDVELRPLVLRPDTHEARSLRCPTDHDVERVADRGTRNVHGPPLSGIDSASDVLGSGPGLAKASSSPDQPHEPRIRRR